MAESSLGSSSRDIVDAGQDKHTWDRRPYGVMARHFACRYPYNLLVFPSAVSRAVVLPTPWWVARRLLFIPRARPVPGWEDFRTLAS